MRFLIFWALFALLNLVKSDENNEIKVFMVPHSHLDIAWLFNPLEYYEGGILVKQFGYYPSVRDSFSNITKSLKTHNRTFSFCEVFYLAYYFEKTKGSSEWEEFKSLFDAGQIDILTGGLNQPDEAVTHYDDIIDVLSLGHYHLRTILNVSSPVRIAASFDPFGHSKSMAKILQNAGFEMLRLGRIDYKDLETRIKNKELEFMWHFDDQFFSDSIFTAASQYGMYSTYPFSIVCEKTLRLYDCFDMLEKKSRISVSEKTKLAKQQFYYELMKQNPFVSRAYLHDIGTDFEVWGEGPFEMIDDLSNYIKEQWEAENPGVSKQLVSAEYSTFQKYYEALMGESKTLPKKYFDDFFPYRTGKNDSWTGFYVSKPILKKIITDSRVALQSLSLMLFPFVLNDDSEWIIDRELLGQRIMPQWAEMNALAQHHDVITGTSENSVDHWFQQKFQDIRALALKVRMSF